jgi:hypothetical protein
VDKRTKAYKKMLVRRKKIKDYLTAAIILTILAYILYIFGSYKAYANHVDSLPVLSPVVSWEPKNDKNTHCIGEYNKLFCDNRYDWDTKTMIAISKCESGLNPNAIALEPNGTWSGGLLQINSVHGNTADKVFDAYTNVYLGYKVYQSQGYYAWTVFNSACYYNALASL